MPVKTDAPQTRFVRTGNRAALAALLFALAIGGSGGAALAHAIVVESALDGGTLAAGRAQDVEVRFNVAIEADFLEAAVEGPAGPAGPVEARQGERPDTMVVRLPALSPGSYLLRYKVLAADGHLSEGALRFTVSAEP